MDCNTRYTLEPSETHPAAYSALEYVRSIPIDELYVWQESFSSCAMAGQNRIAEVCGETLRRVLNGESVSDRYILGLAWEMARLVAMRHEVG